MASGGASIWRVSGLRLQQAQGRRRQRPKSYLLQHPGRTKPKQTTKRKQRTKPKPRPKQHRPKPKPAPKALLTVTPGAHEAEARRPNASRGRSRSPRPSSTGRKQSQNRSQNHARLKLWSRWGFRLDSNRNQSSEALQSSPRTKLETALVKVCFATGNSQRRKP